MAAFSETEYGVPEIKPDPVKPHAEIVAELKKLSAAQERTMNEHFASAKPGAVFAHQANEVLKQAGLTPEQTVLAQSSCPDELNHDNVYADIPRILRDTWGEVFHLGGLAGIPFTGKTGWGAFSHHIPDDGNVVLLFAPHVGVNTKGVVGKVHRPGQAHETTACGASVGAFNALKAKSQGRRLAGGSNKEKAHDQQLGYILEQLEPSMEKLLEERDANKQSALLAYETYEIAARFLEEIIGEKWIKPKSNSKFAILGGIMINVDGPASDYFLPLKFEMRSNAGREDLLHFI